MEKYRPRKFDNVIGLDEKIINCVKHGDIPHLLFSGPAGTGKTTTAKIIINELKADYLELNASSERGIDTIRDKISTFAKTLSTNGNLKIVFLDEADALTKDAQTALRNTMETYFSNCRFILTCNYINNLIEPILSRCKAGTYIFNLPNKEDLLKYLKEICQIENINISLELLEKLMNRNYPDIRACVNQLEELSYLTREITLNDLNKQELLVEELFEKISRKTKFTELRQFVLDSNLDYKLTLREIYLYIFKNLGTYKSKFELLLNAIADCDSKLNISTHQEIQFSYMLWRINKILNTE